MIMFSFKKGRNGYLISPDGECVSWNLKDDYSPFDDDIVMNPVRLYNNARQSIVDTPRNKMEETAHRLAKQGYTVFQKPSTKGNVYGFALIIREGDTEAD